MGELIRELQPSRGLIALAASMFKVAWDALSEQAESIRPVAAKQVRSVEKEIATLQDRIVGATNTQVIAAYEDELADLERGKSQSALA
ncbi:MAG: hypothetical protein AAGA70_02615 [Pseudomonadota bacterium]